MSIENLFCDRFEGVENARLHLHMLSLCPLCQPFSYSVIEFGRFIGEAVNVIVHCVAELEDYGK